MLFVTLNGRLNVKSTSFNDVRPFRNGGIFQSISNLRQLFFFLGGNKKLKRKKNVVVENSRRDAGTLHNLFDPVRDLLPVDPSQSDFLVRARRDDLSGSGRHFPGQCRSGDQSLRDRFRDGEEFRHGGRDHHLCRLGFRHRHDDRFHLRQRTPLIDGGRAELGVGTAGLGAGRPVGPPEEGEEVAEEISRLGVGNSPGLGGQGANHNEHQQRALVHDGRMDEVRNRFTKAVHGAEENWPESVAQESVGGGRRSSHSERLINTKWTWLTSRTRILSLYLPSSLGVCVCV